MKKVFFIFFTSIILLTGCNKWGYVNLKYPTPPAVYLPENIKSIAVANRSLVKKEDKKSMVNESIVSGEIAGPDKIASEQCIKAIFDGINGWRGINIIPVKKKLYGTGTREIPQPLDWTTVKQICDSNRCDVLLVLEIFDSNSDVILTTVTNSINAVISATTNTPTPKKQVKMDVVSFWRLYDPRNNTIIDQYKTSSNLIFDATGPFFNLPPPDALPNTAYNSGNEYIMRFIPGYYWVKRDLYKRGKGSAKQAFLSAFRKSEVANWNGALEAWTELSKTKNRKNAGRACLNAAVANEVLGNTDQALYWAKKAYEDYGDKIARDYAGKLNQRKNMRE